MKKCSIAISKVAAELKNRYTTKKLNNTNNSMNRHCTSHSSTTKVTTIEESLRLAKQFGNAFTSFDIETLKILIAKDAEISLPSVEDLASLAGSVDILDGFFGIGNELSYSDYHDEDKQQKIDNRHKLITWFEESFRVYQEEYPNREMNVLYDYCLYCHNGYPVVLFEGGRFPIVVNSLFYEHSKVGFMVMGSNEKITIVKACFRFINTDNPTPKELRRSKEDIGYTGTSHIDWLVRNRF